MFVPYSQYTRTTQDYAVVRICIVHYKMTGQSIIPLEAPYKSLNKLHDYLPKIV